MLVFVRAFCVDARNSIESTYESKTGKETGKQPKSRDKIDVMMLFEWCGWTATKRDLVYVQKKERGKADASPSKGQQHQRDVCQPINQQASLFPWERGLLEKRGRIVVGNVG